MINSVEIERFKCFDTFRLGLSSLTLLTGYNGAGKSSSLQPLLLLSQALRNPPAGLALPLNGPLVRLGSASEIVSTNVSGPIQLTFSSNDGSQAAWAFESYRGISRHELMLRQASFSFDKGTAPRWHPKTNHSLLDAIKELIFLGAVREPFGEAQPYPDEHSLPIGDVGVDGRFGAYWFIRQADEEVPEPLRHPTDRRVTVRAQIDAWLAELFPESNVNAEEIEGLSLGKTGFKLGRSSDWRRPSNVGFGLSYAFPILVALVCAKAGQIFIVDSPEAHLHPRAQSSMGRILAHFAANGLQIIVESHSDHLLSGIRLAVRDGVLQPNDAAVHFFGTGGSGAKTSTQIGIGLKGEIDHWPTGFFDQSINDLIGLSA
jgi:hypothetical protein